MADKRQFWLQHVEQWEQSDLSQAEYARQHELSLSTFGYYRQCYLKKSRAKPLEASTSLLPVNIADEAPAEQPAQSEVGIILTSPGGIRIELAPGFDPQALQMVLGMLEVA